MSGWFKLHRKLLDSPIAQKPNYLAVLIYLLANANYEPKDLIINNEKITVPVGSFIGSQLKIANFFKISLGSVNKILNYLKSENTIEIKTTNKFSYFSIVNWECYQEDESKKENKMKTTRKQNENNVKQIEEGKEGKEYKKERKNILLHDFLIEELKKENAELKPELLIADIFVKTFESRNGVNDDALMAKYNGFYKYWAGKGDKKPSDPYKIDWVKTWVNWIERK